MSNLPMAQSTFDHAAKLHALWLSDPNNPDAIQLDLTNFNLRGLNLSDLDLRKANLIRCDLSNSKARSVNLEKANLFSCEIFNVDLSGSNLREADFLNCDFSSSNLSGADLTSSCCSGSKFNNVDLSGTTLYGTQLYRVDGDGQWIQSFRIKWHVVFYRQTIYIGCQKHHRTTWENFEYLTISKMHYDAPDWWKQHRDLVFKLHDLYLAQYPTAHPPADPASTEPSPE